jgi:hypothetical protein
VTDYITAAEFKSRQGITVPDKDLRIAEHITAASARVDAYCHRTFGPHTGVATVRYFRPASADTVWIDDAYEITAVAVDDTDSGIYGTSWAITDYETSPANAIGPNGHAGWPTTTLTAIGALSYPYYRWSTPRRRTVAVTAKWGWSAVPADVKEATYLLTNRLSYEVMVPGGVTAPNLEAGLPGSGLRRPYTAEDLLAPYRRIDRSVGIAG